MINEILLKKYGHDTPIYLREILDCFPDLSKSHIYKISREEIALNKIGRLCCEVYWVKDKTILGYTTLTTREYMTKKYIRNNI